MLASFRPTLRSFGPQFRERVWQAIMGASRADVAAIEDKPVVHIFPVFLGYERFEVFGDLGQVLVVGQVESLGKPLHVRVGRDAFPDAVEFA